MLFLFTLVLVCSYLYNLILSCFIIGGLICVYHLVLEVNHTNHYAR